MIALVIQLALSGIGGIIVGSGVAWWLLHGRHDPPDDRTTDSP